MGAWSYPQTSKFEFQNCQDNFVLKAYKETQILKLVIKIKFINSPNLSHPTEQRAYNSQQAGVTTAIVMAILVPVAIASACLVFWIIGFVRRR